VLGALTVFFAWLLAAQILAREWQQLAAAAVASLQIILAFSASIVSNDVGVAVTMTATLAWCAWMLRAPPQRRQGIVLGLLLSISLLTKATELSLLLVVAVVLAVLWRTHSDARKEFWRVAAWTVLIPLVLAAWWYVHMKIVTHSFLGRRLQPHPGRPFRTGVLPDLLDRKAVDRSGLPQLLVHLPLWTCLGRSYRCQVRVRLIPKPGLPHMMVVETAGRGGVVSARSAWRELKTSRAM